jgi:hypothetical protein
LTTKLDQILEFNGKLAAPNKDPINDEGDMILVGDYPWL